jgi:hypothetical protein
MLSDKLVSILNHFSKVELNRLRKFVASPYFNDQEDVLRLFDVLHQALKKDPASLEQLEKQKIWKQLYGAKTYHDGHFRRLCSDLNLLALRFLVAENRQQQPVQEALELQRLLENPGLKKHLNAVERQLQDLFEAETRFSAEAYLNRFQMHWHVLDRTSRIISAGDYAAKLQPANRHLDNFFYINKLKLQANWLLFSLLRATTERFELPEGFWAMLDQSPAASLPIVIAYRKMILCLSHLEQEEKFQEYMTVLEQQGHTIAHNDLRECYLFAQGYAALKINQGKTDYYREVFRILKNMIESDLLLRDRQIPEGVFKNGITASLRVGEFAWAEHFIETYSQYLPESIRENARTFNLANLYSHQKQHGRVIELLRNVEYSDVVYALSSKVILVRTYYESDEFMALDSLIDSFRIYLRRNKLISKSVKNEYNTFLGFVKKLSTLPPHQRDAVQNLRSKIEKSPSVPSKKWLLEKLDEL